MKKLEIIEMSEIEGGGQNRDCMIMGGLATLALVTFRFDAAIGVVFGATAYGCFDEPN